MNVCSPGPFIHIAHSNKNAARSSLRRFRSIVLSGRTNVRSGTAPRCLVDGKGLRRARRASICLRSRRRQQEIDAGRRVSSAASTDHGRLAGSKRSTSYRGTLHTREWRWSGHDGSWRATLPSMSATMTRTKMHLAWHHPNVSCRCESVERGSRVPATISRPSTRLTPLLKMLVRLRPSRQTSAPCFSCSASCTRSHVPLIGDTWIPLPMSHDDHRTTERRPVATLRTRSLNSPPSGRIDQ